MKNGFIFERKKILSAVFLLLTIACTVIIFSNSMNIGLDSGRQSGKVVQAVIKVADVLGIKINNVESLHHIVRKSAHFLEYALLGALSFFTLKIMGMKTFPRVYFTLGYSLLIAGCDEYIQTFREGRSGQVSDAFLDFSGAATAVALCLLVFFLIKRHKSRKINKEKEV